MQIRQDESYEGIAAEYQYQVIAMLGAALERTALSEKQRREVCEIFTFDMAMLHDQGEVRVEGHECQPVLAFQAGVELLIPNEQFELHECALGNVSEYFESHDNTS